MTDQQGHANGREPAMQEYRAGWNDAMRGRPRQSSALIYLVGYADASKPR
ncbi:hypothetical protein AH2_0006 [Burkholderia phage vB_BceS_AH2]|uniref:Uncharacterized protein n=1 Tax=Burkholderia phage vB_BceS_AH2 TaxID=1133022 RepID=I6NSF1_9CAUD|nr:hypothetical protein B613_gp06 [Burkholderia phage vB_BceS_AH2]AEY69517.1 hypothetical protein AH2_0006 [Burkholderia phage vB_BceS_AH2]